MSDYRIRFNRPTIIGNELGAVAEAIASGHIAGDGPFTKRCERLLADDIGAQRVLLTSSCTHALEMSALLLDIGPADEVIVPSFTFASSINAFVLRGARAVFADVRPDTLNIDERQIEALITEHTRAIVVVHYAGVACEMETIMDVATRHRLAVVEDAAHGLFATYRGRPLGSFGGLGTFSFHETKNITCGEGGALAINDAALIDRAEILREKGTDRTRFCRGQVEKYTWVDIGSSYLMADTMAAFLGVQLAAHAIVQEKRRRIWDRYFDGLADWAPGNDVALPSVPSECEHPSHLFYLLLPSTEARDKFIESMRAVGIQTAFHYQPLHASAMGRQNGIAPFGCPVASDISARLVRLPFHTGLTPPSRTRFLRG